MTWMVVSNASFLIWALWSGDSCFVLALRERPLQGLQQGWGGLGVLKTFDFCLISIVASASGDP